VPLDAALLNVSLPDICVSSPRHSTAPCDKAGSFASPRGATAPVTHKRITRGRVTHNQIGKVATRTRCSLFVLTSTTVERKSNAETVLG
jgi:hypothetical protein